MTFFFLLQVDISISWSYGHLLLERGDPRLCRPVFRIGRPHGVREPNQVLAARTPEGPQWTVGLGCRGGRSFRDLQKKNGIFFYYFEFHCQHTFKQREMFEYVRHNWLGNLVRMERQSHA